MNQFHSRVPNNSGRPPVGTLYVSPITLPFVFALFLECPIRVFVYPLTRPYGHDFNLPFLHKPIDDPVPSHAIASESRKFLRERFSRIRVCHNRMKRCSYLFLDIRMQRAEERSGPVGDAQFMRGLLNSAAQSKSSSRV